MKKVYSSSEALAYWIIGAYFALVSALALILS